MYAGRPSGAEAAAAAAAPAGRTLGSVGPLPSAAAASAGGPSGSGGEGGSGGVGGRVELLVFGYACKLFRDDEKALKQEQGRQLIPWMGDASIMIDRSVPSNPPARLSLLSLCCCFFFSSSSF